ncbi:hypothetical protein RP20_CCG011652 [Aedes albopictus]|nr:hypothetical protein RP20_CCG011652 [Aedes albopictus]
MAASKSSDKPVLVATDSASVLLALESPKSKHPWIQKTQKFLEEEGHRIIFTWVPGHCGISGNEEADTMANIGRTGRRRTQHVPGADVKLWCRRTIEDAWSAEWRANRSLFFRKIKGDTETWKDRHNWREQVILSRLRTGHSRISHNFSGGSTFRKICDTCNILNTVEHVLCECPKLEYLRTSHQLGSITDVLQNHETSEAKLITFLKEAGLFVLI